MSTFVENAGNGFNLCYWDPDQVQTCKFNTLLQIMRDKELIPVDCLFFPIYLLINPADMMCSREYGDSKHPYLARFMG
jgi:hypothetical protein